jgi:hypothetical protein
VQTVAASLATHRVRLASLPVTWLNGNRLDLEIEPPVYPGDMPLQPQNGQFLPVPSAGQLLHKKCPFKNPPALVEIEAQPLSG